MAQPQERLLKYLDHRHLGAHAAVSDVDTVSTLSPAAAARVRRLLERADLTLRNLEATHEWVMTPLGVRGGHRPADAAISGDSGLQEAIALLGRIDHGVYSEVFSPLSWGEATDRDHSDVALTRRNSRGRHSILG
jgi:hypothetical protein